MTDARRGQAGLTLVELMVAMALSLLIALAAMAALMFSNRGFAAVDAASALRDNARFGASLLQRVIVQAGFLDWRYAMHGRSATKDLADVPTVIRGFNNASLATSTPFNAGADPLAKLDHDSRSADCNTPQGEGCSDLLIVRYQSQGLSSADAAASDQSMIDCSGRPLSEAPRSRDDQGISIFYVSTDRGEPTLMCLSGRQAMSGGVLVSSWQPPVPLISGVESFQLLFGTDGVTPGAAPTADHTSVPSRYLRADELDVGNHVANTRRNWRRVRSVRVGMVLRGPVGSAQPGLAEGETVFPFGAARNADSGTQGFALSSANDKGTRYVPARVDSNRLRQTVTFTVHLRNDQGLCVGRACTD